MHVCTESAPYSPSHSLSSPPPQLVPTPPDKTCSALNEGSLTLVLPTLQCQKPNQWNTHIDSKQSKPVTMRK
jgi:hypothetical protein